jgi:hypothetical protein
MEIYQKLVRGIADAVVEAEKMFVRDISLLHQVPF